MLLCRTPAFCHLGQSVNGHSNRRATHCAFLTRTYIIIKSTCRRYHNNTHTWSRIVMIRTNYLVVCIISIAASPLLLLPPPVRHAPTTPEKRFIPPLYFILLYYYCRRIFFFIKIIILLLLIPIQLRGDYNKYNNSGTLRAFEWQYNMYIVQPSEKFHKRRLYTSTSITVALLLLYYYIYKNSYILSAPLIWFSMPLNNFLINLLDDA